MSACHGHIRKMVSQVLVKESRWLCNEHTRGVSTLESTNRHTFCMSKTRICSKGVTEPSNGLSFLQLVLIGRMMELEHCMYLVSSLQPASHCQLSGLCIMTAKHSPSLFQTCTGYDCWPSSLGNTGQCFSHVNAGHIGALRPHRSQ